jgi:hypothetical protein
MIKEYSDQRHPTARRHIIEKLLHALSLPRPQSSLLSFAAAAEDDDPPAFADAIFDGVFALMPLFT